MARNTILIVDDEAAIRFAVKDFLETDGYKTIEALEGYLEPTYSVAPDLDEFLALLNA